MVNGISTVNEAKPIQNLVFLIDNIKMQGIDLQPKYQRGFIWNNEFMDKLIYSIIRQYPIGNIILREMPDGEVNPKGAKFEVVDGQQRLTTIYRFVKGQYEIQSDTSRQIIEYLRDSFGSMDDYKNDEKLRKLIHRLENKGKINLSYENLPIFVKSLIVEGYALPCATLRNAHYDEVALYFRYLQNQERLRAGEIINSIPESSLEDYLIKINTKNEFLEIISSKNDRKQFDKAFYSIIGLLDGQIALGVTDKDVLNFVAGCNNLQPNIEEDVNRLIDVINYIGNLNLPKRFVSYNIRALKFFMLLAATGKVDFKTRTDEKLKILENINHKLSTFNSAKPTVVEKNFPGYEDGVKQEYQQLTMIAKGAQPRNRVINRIDILAYYINNWEEKHISSGIELI